MDMVFQHSFHSCDSVSWKDWAEIFFFFWITFCMIAVETANNFSFYWLDDIFSEMQIVLESIQSLKSMQLHHPTVLVRRFFLIVEHSMAASSYYYSTVLYYFDSAFEFLWSRQEKKSSGSYANLLCV